MYRNLASGVRTYEHPSDEQYRAYYRSVKAEEEPPRRLNDDALATTKTSAAAAAAAVPGVASGGSRPRIQISISDGGDWAEDGDEDGGDGGGGGGGAEPSLLGEGDFYAGAGHYAAAAAAAERAARSRATVAAAKVSSIDALRPGPGMWHSRSMSKRRGEMDAAADIALGV